MQQDANEENKSCKDRGTPDYSRIPIAVHHPELLGKRENDEDGDDYPAIVQTDANPKNASEVYLGSHGGEVPKLV